VMNRYVDQQDDSRRGMSTAKRLDKSYLSK